MTAKSSNQSGNVFFIILIGIVMFAALMFTFSRGVRQSTEGIYTPNSCCPEKQ